MPHETSGAAEQSWQSITTPFTVDLYSVVQTDDGPFAVGGGGTVVANRGQGWEPVVASGPADQNSTLRAIATTENGKRVWVAGASGAIGMYDLIRDRKYDFSYSKDISDSWQSIAVFGSAGSEKVFVANGSGTILSFTLSGLEATDYSPSKPGSGSAIGALAATADGVVYAADTGGNVYEKRPGEWVAIGIAEAQATLTDVAVGPKKTVSVAAGDGQVYRYDPAAETWTSIEVPAAGLRAVDSADGHLVAVSESNTVFRRPIDGRTSWREESTPTGNDLLDIALGYPDIVVGKAGTVIERPPRTPPTDRETSPTEPDENPAQADPCARLETELLTRLERSELEYLLRHSECESPLLDRHGLLTGEETESVLDGRLGATQRLPVVALPVAGDIAGTKERTRHRSSCECGEPGARLENVLLERLLCE
jgi:hypothetical protein